MAKNLAVIGDSESIKGFGAIGFDIFPCDNPENAAHLFRQIADSDNYAVIYMTEELFVLVEKERKRYEDRLVPAVLPLPGVKGNTGIGAKRLSSFVEQAVGSDILFNS
jgi:V/A-type H+-transporting ATPase subunit F